MIAGECVLTVLIPGEAQPQGSASAWVPTDKAGNPYRRAPSGRNARGAIIVNVTSDNKDLKKWREKVAAAAVKELDGARPQEDVGFTLEAIAYLRRPQGHWGTGRNAAALKDHAPAFPLVIPDVDKLLRAFMDALTGVVWKDDSQVTDAIARKRFAVPAGPDDDGICAALRVWLNHTQHAGELEALHRTRWVPGPEGQQALAVDRHPV